MTTETLEERATRIRKDFFSPRSEFAHKHNPGRICSKYIESGFSRKDSKEIARHYSETFYTPVINIANYACLR